MGVFRRAIRAAAYAGLGLLAAYLALAAAIHIQQRIFRHRAERLLADVQSLRVRQATFDQAVEVFDRWQPWGSYDLPCSRESCTFSIALTDFGAVTEGEGWYQWAFHLYRGVGSRLAGTRASIWVRDGVVSNVQFDLAVEVPPFSDRAGNTVTYVLIARTFAVSRFGADLFVQGRSHPDYEIGGPSGCTDCVMIWFNYTPYASAADLHQVGKPDFACITSWRPCRTKEDIMPRAMAQVAIDGSLDPNERASCDSRVVTAISRDAANVAAVEVVENEGDEECEGCRFLRVRLLKRLKRSDFLAFGSIYKLGVLQDIAIAPFGKVSAVHPGTRVIIVFDRSLHPDPRVPFLEEPCGVIPLSAPMLQIVGEGIARDDLPPWSGNPDFVQWQPR